MRIRVTEPNENLVNYCRRCWKNAETFDFYGEQFTLVFFEITRNADDTAKRIDFELVELPK